MPLHVFDGSLVSGKRLGDEDIVSSSAPVINS